MKDNGSNMAWNEPGKGNKKDPWGKNNEGPPDLDKVVKDFNEKLKNMFKGGNGGSGGGNDSGGDFSSKGVFMSFGAFFAVIAVLFIVAGFYIVRPAEQAVVTRFGKYQRTVGQGPHWLFPILESKRIVNTEKVESTTHRGTMLTKDENIVDVSMEVQYRLDDIENYLFNVFDPKNSLRQAADSALRQVIGNSTLSDILARGKTQISDAIYEKLKATLERYDSGIYVVAVAFKEANPPSSVKAAFDDVTQAREERERLKNQAESYANKILPEARGQAQKILEEAQAYKESKILDATGDINRFNSLLTEYEKAPGITKKRLYLDTLESVLANSSKVLVDVNSGNNLIYLPIDKLMSNNSSQKNKVEHEDVSTEDLVKKVERSDAADKARILREQYENMRRGRR